MKIHEYQAKDLFAQYGIPVMNGNVAENGEQAVKAAEELKSPYVLKAQIHSGGRGKAGGVKVVRTMEEVRTTAEELIGKTLVTAQTGPEGRVVQKILVTEAADVKKEYYFAMTVDRDTGRLAMIASSEGGVEIEQVSRETPEKIITETIDPAVGLHDYRLRYLAEKLGIADVKGFIRTGLGMYRLFCEKDCSLVEINPLAELSDGTITALDAKVNFDDNALYKHPDIAALTDPNEEDPRELEANKYGLNYVSLGGNVGCLVNGAGLAMATMDMIHYAGAVPANFLDVGGTATAEKVTKAFEIILSDKGVQAILVNIFGGIIKCDMIAEGIIQAARNTEIKVPIVARLEGTNVEQGKQLLLTSGMNIIPASSLREGAEICAKIVKEGN